MAITFKKICTIETALLLIISAIVVMTIIGLWIIGAKAESLISLLVGLSIWSIKILVNEHYKEIDRKIDHQYNIILQRTQTSFGFKQKVMTNMYDVTNKLWEQSIWIAGNWSALWPGHDKDKEIRSTFKTKLDDYIEFLKINSINIPSNIYEATSKIIDGINTYEFGRMERDEKNADVLTRKHGAEEMSKGAKIINKSINDLFQKIRDEFGLGHLPGEILQIKQPDEVES